MRKFLSNILLFTLLFCLPNLAHAQFGKLLKKAKKKAKQKVEQKVKDKVESTKKTETSKTSKPYEQSQGSVEQTQKNTDAKPKNNQSKPDRKHEDAVVHFLIRSMAFTTGESYATYREPAHYTEANGFPMEDAIYVVHTDLFKRESNLLKEFYENLKNPKYTEIRYALTDQVYKNQMADREMYPNKDRSDISDRPLKVRYQLLKFIGDYMLKDDPDILAEAAYVKKKMDKIDEKFEAKLNAVAINDVHKANLYKVIFTSNKNIDPKTAPASAYKTTFKPGDEIFAVAMVDKPLNKNIIKGAYPHLEMISGMTDRVETVVEHQMFPVKPNQKYFVFPIVVKSANFKCSDTEATANTEYAMRWLSDKEDRRFKIEVWLKEGGDYHNSSGSLKGTFTYDASEVDGAVLRKMANQVAAKCGRE